MMDGCDGPGSGTPGTASPGSEISTVVSPLPINPSNTFRFREFLSLRMQIGGPDLDFIAGNMFQLKPGPAGLERTRKSVGVWVWCVGWGGIAPVVVC